MRFVVIAIALAGCHTPGGTIDLPPLQRDDAMVSQQDDDAGTEEDAGIDNDAGTDWFRDSGWYCCTVRACDGLRCDGDEVATTNGAGTYYCAPDFGQCD